MVEGKKEKQGQIQIELKYQEDMLNELESRISDLNIKLELILTDEDKTEDEKEDEKSLVMIANIIRNNTKRLVNLSSKIRNIHERVEI